MHFLSLQVTLTLGKLCKAFGEADEGESWETETSIENRETIHSLTVSLKETSLSIFYYKEQTVFY